MLSTIEQRARRGALWLDEHRGENWPRKVDLSELDMGDAFRCVLSQVTGESYTQARTEAGLSRQEAHALGFIHRPGSLTEYARLTAAWRREIRKRLGWRRYLWHMTGL